MESVRLAYFSPAGPGPGVGAGVIWPGQGPGNFRPEHTAQGLWGRCGVGQVQGQPVFPKPDQTWRSPGLSFSRCSPGQAVGARWCVGRTAKAGKASD